MNKLILLISFSILVFCVGCKDDNDPVVVDVWNINLDPRFEATIDGQSVRFTSDQHLVGVGISSSIGVSTPSTFEYESNFSSIRGERAVAINKGTLNLPLGGFPDKGEFLSFFQKGSVPFSKDAEDGIEIWFNDGKGTSWSTSKGTGDQTGSTFNFEVISDFSGFDVWTVKYRASFTCTLYDDDGNSVELTNGKSMAFFSDE
ncbi:MAG: hypothetical protein JJ975_06135 [Bacteroidia bacterium]|nr:hypothetical protein [Bacteroidia bacterium]